VQKQPGDALIPVWQGALGKVATQHLLGPIDVRVVQRTLGLRLAGEASVHEFTIDQPRVIGHDVELGFRTTP